MALSAVKPLNSAEAIFRYADAFAEASEKLGEQFRKEPSGSQLHFTQAAHIAPTATLEAFSVELYLKCLHVLDFGKAPLGHNCQKLFESLAPGTQEGIRHCYREQLKKDYKIVAFLHKNHPEFEPTLENSISLSKEVFTAMRYGYEGGKGRMFIWPVLRKAIRMAILAIRPDFANLG